MSTVFSKGLVRESFTLIPIMLPLWSPIFRAWSTLLKILKGMFRIKSKHCSEPSAGNHESNETRLDREDNFSYVWFITSSKNNSKARLPKMFCKKEACKCLQGTNLKRFPTIHLLMDNLGHYFLKQSLTILLTHLFPSSFSNFAQFPLPLFSCSTIPSTKLCLLHTYRNQYISYLF